MSDKTILIVDDVPDNIAVLGGILRDTYRIKPAPGGDMALKIARSPEKIDLILLDIMMPGMDGYQVLRELKADPATASIPVIFVSAMSERTDEKIGRDLGASDYLTKPVDPQQVLKAVREVIGS